MKTTFTLPMKMGPAAICLTGLFFTLPFSDLKAQEQESKKEKRIEIHTSSHSEGGKTEKMEYSNEDGERKVVVTTIEDGKTVEKVYKGQEAEDYMKEHHVYVEEEEATANKIMYSYNNDGNAEVVVRKIELEHLDELEEKLEDLKIELKNTLDDKDVEEILEAIGNIDIDIDVKDGNERVHIVRMNHSSKGEAGNNVVVISNATSVENNEEANELLKDLGVSLDIDENKEGTVKTIVYKKIIRIENVTKADALSSNERLKVSDMSIYPNPNTGMFNIEFNPEKETETTIRVTDVNGRELFLDTYDGVGQYKKELDLSSEKNGIYFVQITQGKKQHTKKIVIQ